ncbi:MAG: DUF3298 domain-containing protein [Clostridia bacterium]|nr:DUF3298 domain-containing protein [Clostridia bacterium]
MKRLALTALAILAALWTCACSASATPIRIEPEEAILAYGQTRSVPTPSLADGSSPLSIIRGVQSCGDGYIVYPRTLYSTYSQEINESILEITADRAREISVPIFTKYRIEYNRNGIFSLRMGLYDLHGDSNECLKDIYLTYDVENGTLCDLDDLFDGEDERWRGVMPDIITAQAEAKGLTLLCDVMPIADNQQFFITKDEVVLVYKLYEIATWSAGEPEFAIPIAQLAEFIPVNSPLAKVAAEETQAGSSAEIREESISASLSDPAQSAGTSAGEPLGSEENTQEEAERASGILGRGSACTDDPAGTQPAPQLAAVESALGEERP